MTKRQEWSKQGSKTIFKKIRGGGEMGKLCRGSEKKERENGFKEKPTERKNRFQEGI